MNRRDTVLALLSLGVAPLAVEAQHVEKAWRIGFLNVGTPAVSGHYLEALRRGLRELGYVEGQSFVIEARWAEGNVGRLPNLAADLVQHRVDVIVTAGPPQVRAAQHATSTIPIVMVSGADPIALGFAASLARPGFNITGMTNMATETAEKLIQFAHEIVPNATYVGFLMSDSPSMRDNWIDAQKAAKQLNLKLVPLRAKNPEEIEGAFSSARKGKTEVIVVATDAFLQSQRKQIVALAAGSHLPVVYSRGEYVRDGGLVSYGLSLTEANRHAAIFVDKILKGIKPGEIPFEQPTKFELVVNLKTAKALGITIPQSMLLRADEVIQ